MNIRDEILILGSGVSGLSTGILLLREGCEKQRLEVHNYGHGGSGFTLSWGCAQDVVEIIEKL